MPFPPISMLKVYDSSVGTLEHLPWLKPLFRIVCLFQPPNTKAQVCILCVGAIELLHPLRTSQRNCRAHRTCPIRNVSCLQMSVVWSSHGSLAIFQAWSAKRNTSADQYQRAPDVIKWDQSRYDNKNEEEEWRRRKKRRREFASAQITRAQGSQTCSPVGAPLLALADSLPPVLKMDVGCFYKGLTVLHTGTSSTLSSLVASLRQIERQGRLPSTRWPNQHDITLIPKMRQNLHRQPKILHSQQISFTLNCKQKYGPHNDWLNCGHVNKQLLRWQATPSSTFRVYSIAFTSNLWCKIHGHDNKICNFQKELWLETSKETKKITLQLAGCSSKNFEAQKNSSWATMVM